MKLSWTVRKNYPCRLCNQVFNWDSPGWKKVCWYVLIRKNCPVHMRCSYSNQNALLKSCCHEERDTSQNHTLFSNEPLFIILNRNVLSLSSSYFCRYLEYNICASNFWTGVQFLKILRNIYIHCRVSFQFLFFFFFFFFFVTSREGQKVINVSDVHFLVSNFMSFSYLYDCCKFSMPDLSRGKIFELQNV